MKKIITLFLFVVAVAFNAQHLNAQDVATINSIANEKTKDVKKNVKLEKQQMEAVYQAYKEYQLAFSKIEDNLDTNQERLEKINNVLDEKLKTIMTSEQFERYLRVYRTH